MGTAVGRDVGRVVGALVGVIVGFAVGALDKFGFFDLEGIGVGIMVGL